MHPAERGTGKRRGSTRALAAVTDDTRALAERLVHDELATWAAEIHDTLTQTVAASILELDVLGTFIERDPAAAADMVLASAEQLRGAMADVREVLFHLTDDAPHAGDIEMTVADARSRWRIQIACTGDPSTLEGEVAEAACLVVREALANAARHADACSAVVDVRREGPKIIVTVHDQGGGVMPESRDRHHFGLRIMERRVVHAGGTLAVLPGPKGGTRVVATFSQKGVA